MATKDRKESKNRSEYLRQYHAAHKPEEAAYKARQRARDDVVMFHVKRLVRYGYPLPGWVEADPRRVERMRQRLEKAMAEPVQVEVSGSGGRRIRSGRCST